MSNSTPPRPPSADDACVLCGYWRCRCEEVLRATHTHTAV